MNINPDSLAVIVGVFMPVIVSLVKRPEWPTWAKMLVAGLASLAVGTVTTAVSGQVNVVDDPGTAFQAAAWAFAAATTAYKLWFEGVNNGKLEKALTKWPLP